MDSKDFQLLVALHIDARQSYQSLGRHILLSAPAARERLNRLKSTGVLLGYGLWVDPKVFERDEVLVFFKRERQRKEVVQALKAPEVAWIGWKLDGGLTVGAWTLDIDRAIGGLESALGEPSSGHAVTARSKAPPPTALDWLIIDALIDDPRMPLKGLIELTGLSSKTVRKHLNRLLESQTVIIMPRLGAMAGSGELVYQISVAGKVPMSELRSVMGDAILLHQTHEPPMKYLLSRSRDLAEVSLKTRALTRLQDVESAGISLNRELLFATDFPHSLVRWQIHLREEEQRRSA